MKPLNVDLDSLSLKELKNLQTQIAASIASFEERKKKQAISELEERARSLGFSLGELLDAAQTRKRAPGKPKYANPANRAETWTGRGRKPRWVEAALKAGKSLDDLAI